MDIIWATSWHIIKLSKKKNISFPRKQEFLTNLFNRFKSYAGPHIITKKQHQERSS